MNFINISQSIISNKTGYKVVRLALPRKTVDIAVLVLTALLDYSNESRWDLEIHLLK